jgi:serine/threonine-protein kinase
MNEPLLDGRYRLISPLAEGGMSVVWRGHDDVLARPVAVKVIRADAGPDTKCAQRVRREATALARLNHGHIANVYDYGESYLDGARAPYLVMELVEGESLGAVLRRGALPWPTAVSIAAQVAAALATAHACGVVHCDVTPGNVMLCGEGVKIIDFGIASTAGDHAEGVVFGTPAYLAPERRAGGLANPASDVYGVGLLLYEMLAGRLPWPDGTATEVVAAHRNVPPAPLPDVPGLPARVRSLCLACLDVDPSRRPSSREAQVGLTSAWRTSDPQTRRAAANTSRVPIATTIPGPAPTVSRTIEPVGARPRALVSSLNGAGGGRPARIMPHGMTSVPDLGRATEPLDEEPDGDRSRRAFFALPSLLLIVLVVSFGLAGVQATGGGIATPAPSIGPAAPQPSTKPTGVPPGKGRSSDAGATRPAGGPPAPSVPPSHAQNPVTHSPSALRSSHHSRHHLRAPKHSVTPNRSPSGGSSSGGSPSAAPPTSQPPTTQPPPSAAPSSAPADGSTSTGSSGSAPSAGSPSKGKASSQSVGSSAGSRSKR